MLFVMAKKFKKFVLVEEDRVPKYLDYVPRSNVDDKRVKSLENEMETIKTLPPDVQKHIANKNIQTLLKMNEDMKRGPSPPPSPPRPEKVQKTDDVSVVLSSRIYSFDEAKNNTSYYRFRITCPTN